MIRAALALALLCLSLCVPAGAQSSWCGSNCGAISPDVARWIYDNDPERKRERAIADERQRELAERREQERREMR